MQLVGDRKIVERNGGSCRGLLGRAGSDEEVIEQGSEILLGSCTDVRLPA